jgi:hypothetical protein
MELALMKKGNESAGVNGTNNRNHQCFDGVTSATTDLGLRRQ